jgi:glycosyltransferase involved in cell wall biosynthesis
MLETETPLVSIVTPSFHQARFLRRTIDSVLAQTYRHIEYIVVDGGSRDGSVDILKSYGERVRWVSEPDRGQSDAINKGFSRFRGEILAYVNSDDVLLPDAVATAVRHLSKDSECDLVYGDAFFIDADDNVLAPYPTEEYTFDRLMQTCFICQPATFWRRRIAERIGPLDERLHYVMDYEYWMRMDRAGARLVHIPECLALARVHPHSKTQACREAMFHEMFAACVKRAGYVGYSQLLAYWHYMCHARPHGWPQRFRHVAGFPEMMANFHYRWLRNGKALVPFCADAIAGMTRRLFRQVRRCLGALSIAGRV